jgi:hypothetical protein
MAKKGQDEKQVPVKPDALKPLFEGEIKKVSEIMQKRFEAYDSDK